MPDTTTARMEALRAVAERFGLDEQGQYSGAEDFAAYMDGDEPIARFCAVTCAGDFVYIKTYGDANGAMERAMANITDDIYAETPVAVVDLDSGATRVPDWDALPWKLER